MTPSPSPSSTLAVYYTSAFPDTLQSLSTTDASPSDTNSDLTSGIQRFFSEEMPQLTSSIQLQQHAKISQVVHTVSTATSNVFGVVQAENSETGSFRSVFEDLQHAKLAIVGEFAVSSQPLPGTWLATRYIVVTPQSASNASTQHSQRQLSAPGRSTSYKSTAIMKLKHQPGAVFKALSAFALRDVNVLKFAGLPTASSALLQRGRQTSSDKLSSLTSVLPPAPTSGSVNNVRWDYSFLVDYEPHQSSSVNAAVEATLREFSLEYHNFGTYRSNLQPIFASQTGASGIERNGTISNEQQQNLLNITAF